MTTILDLDHLYQKLLAPSPNFGLHTTATVSGHFMLFAHYNNYGYQGRSYRLWFDAG